MSEKQSSSIKEPLVITGARGRIARSIVELLGKDCPEIVRVSRTSGEGCLSHEDAFDSDVFGNSSVILHAAWSSVPATSESHPGIEWRNDLPFLARILESLKDCGDEKPLFVLLSSAGTVYGNATGRPSLESDPPGPIGWYGRGKVAAETLCRHFADAYGIPLLILRVSNPYGLLSQHNRPQGLISAALHAARGGMPLKVWGDGSALKDFLHCRDLAKALSLAFRARLTGVYNIGYGKSHRVLEVLEMVERAIGRKLDLDFIPAPRWDVTDSRVDCESFFSAVNWRPSIDLETGVRKCVESGVGA